MPNHTTGAGESDMVELAERCEKATAQYQRRLLSEAYRLMFGGPECIIIDRWPGYSSPRWDAYHKMLEAEAYESAAMMLVPEDGNHFPRVSRLFNGQWQSVCYEQFSGEGNEATAATPALALCAAALRSRSTLTTSTENGDATEA